MEPLPQSAGQLSLGDLPFADPSVAQGVNK